MKPSEYRDRYLAPLVERETGLPDGAEPRALAEPARFFFPEGDRLPEQLKGQELARYLRARLCENLPRAPSPAELERCIDAWAKAHTDLATAHERSEQERVRLQQILDRMSRSRSWRYTAGIRRAWGRLRQLLGAGRAVGPG